MGFGWGAPGLCINKGLVLTESAKLEDAHFPFAALKSLVCSDTELREVELPQASACKHATKGKHG